MPRGGVAFGSLSLLAWLRQYFVVVLAGARERRAHAETAAIHRERQQHRLRQIARLRANRNDAAARLEVRIVDELVGTHDRRERNAGFLELRHELVHAMAA